MARILVVEDEADLAELVAFNLRQGGHEVVSVEGGADALAEIRRRRPDLVLLDLMLPDVGGLEICRRLRRNPETADLPIVILTAKGHEMDRVVGFEVGADDYVTKPFSPRELVLRIEAVLRRSAAPPGRAEDEAGDETVRIGDLCVEIEAHHVTVAGAAISLTALEHRLLADLARRKGRVQSRDALLERVWGYAPGVETRTVDTHIKRLRIKLGTAATCLETVRGVGYRLRAPSDAR
ncbi:MAG: response regulator [Myxococcales bacterium]|nr:response regulator [Myxococcales bacterium]